MYEHILEKPGIEMFVIYRFVDPESHPDEIGSEPFETSRPIRVASQRLKSDKCSDPFDYLVTNKGISIIEQSSGILQNFDFGAIYEDGRYPDIEGVASFRSHGNFQSNL